MDEKEGSPYTTHFGLYTGGEKLAIPEPFRALIYW